MWRICFDFMPDGPIFWKQNIEAVKSKTQKIFYWNIALNLFSYLILLSKKDSLSLLSGYTEVLFLVTP